MANGGFFLGGIAEGFQSQQTIGQRSRALDIQENTLQQQQRQNLIAEANKRIDSTMKTIGSVIDGAKAGGLNLDDMSVYANAIAQMETGGQSSGYTTVHPPAPNGDQAFGLYGVMGNNIGPWTQEVLGRALTPDEFLASPEAQDAVFRAKFGQALEANDGSVADAASVWFTGRPLSEGAEASDGNLTGQQYVERFLRNVAGAPQQRLGAAVEPLLQSVEGIASSIGADPALYRRQTEALIQATPTAAEEAIATGTATGRQRLAEAQTLINAGIARADALATAGIQSVDETGVLEPDKAVELEQKLRKEFTDVSGDFITVRDAFQRIQSVYNNPSADTGVTDVAMIFNYMKMLDPGSVVRESEYATVGNAQGVPARIRNLYNQALSGAQIDQKTRDDIFTIAGRLFEGQQAQHQRIVDQFTDISTSAGLDPGRVILDVGVPALPAADLQDPLGIR